MGISGWKWEKEKENLKMTIRERRIKTVRRDGMRIIEAGVWGMEMGE